MRLGRRAWGRQRIAPARRSDASQAEEVAACNGRDTAPPPMPRLLRVLLSRLSARPEGIDEVPVLCPRVQPHLSNDSNHSLVVTSAPPPLTLSPLLCSLVPPTLSL